ncbi:hypothetical protein [Kitasatospora sp. NPDC092286]|uniref:hypothetical protein n=1 Tax=Kitasatospora sp. NPDC092286 TaxID=3364087 RepID=UPI00380DA946
MNGLPPHSSRASLHSDRPPRPQSAPGRALSPQRLEDRPLAEHLASQAHQLGKPIHIGRVNSRRRLGIADWFGCASADGTYLTYGPDQNLPRLLRWLGDLDHQPTLLTPERTP